MRPLLLSCLLIGCAPYESVHLYVLLDDGPWSAADHEVELAVYHPDLDCLNRHVDSTYPNAEYTFEPGVYVRTAALVLEKGGRVVSFDPDEETADDVVAVADFGEVGWRRGEPVEQAFQMAPVAVDAADSIWQTAPTWDYSCAYSRTRNGAYGSSTPIYMTVVSGEEAAPPEHAVEL